jgi:hypothetical protein
LNIVVPAPSGCGQYDCRSRRSRRGGGSGGWVTREGQVLAMLWTVDAVNDLFGAVAGLAM